MVVFQSENLRTKFSESLTIHLIHAYIIMSIHQVLRGESQVSVNSERTWWQTESSLKGSRFIKTLLMFRLIGLFNLTAQCICIFSHFVPVVLSHDEVLPGWGVHDAWRKLAGFQKEKKKTGNESSYQHIADHVSALYVFVVVTCMGNQCIIACRLLVELCFIYVFIYIVDGSWKSHHCLTETVKQ